MLYITKDSRAPYLKFISQENKRYGNTRKQQGWNYLLFKNEGRVELATIIEGKKNGGSKQGDMSNGKDHRRYCKFYDSIGHDIIKCTMLRRELEKKYTIGVFERSDERICSRQLEIIELVEPNIKSFEKGKILMFV